VIKLPAKWIKAPLTDLVEIHDSRRIPLNQAARATRRGAYPYLGANGQVDTIDDFLFDGDFVLLAEDGGYFDDPYRNVAYLASGKFWVNNHAHVLRGRNGVCNEFLCYLFNSMDWMPYVSGTTRLKLPQAGMQRVGVPLPPFGEQHRIVTKLDSLFARTRSAREELARIPRLIEHYKQAILAAAFRGELTADWRAENAPAPVNGDLSGIDSRAGTLPRLPFQWSWTSVGAVSAISGGLTKSARRRELQTHVPYLRVANVYTNELRLDDVQEIGCTPQELEKTALEEGDLLIVEGNGSLDQIGRVALWDASIPGCSHQNHLIRARPRSNVLPDFLLYWMLSPLGREYIERVASSSSGLHTLSISKVSGLPFPLCSRAEMSEIAERVRQRLDEVANLATERDRAAKLLDHLDQANLAKAFRGELVFQDPNDEPAAALLERLRATRPMGGKQKRRVSKTLGDAPC
jgi:type I restriction enzyme, S subunit